ncbi:trypsin-like peptidase domain-containing protein [Filimonas effusa]|uniref:Serine protease n=1 Tax=Filimonas effusa TaxID=2508721 RepID=A0A4Q1DAF3_9BACT|nr:trypsin-like peptidase domain-containing protein [Filimonas effusa]RXK86382.1 serine protease [Filimonas effusa]
MWKYLQLCQTLKALYYTQEEIITLLKKAGLEAGDFNLTGRGIVVWVGIITRLEQLDNIKQLVQAALEDFPKNPVLLATMADHPQANAGVYNGREIDWKDGPVSKKTLEKITGEKSTLLPVSFMEKGIIKARAVARIETSDSLGTGFLISKDNLFLTNNHVLHSREESGLSKVQFNYQKTNTGALAIFEEFEVDNTVFETSVADDWSIVKIKGNPAEKYGFLKLTETKTRKDDFVNIIQHPGGEDKKIGIYHNIVTYADDNIVQYLTDTMPGSSGAPVFDSDWNVVALHHSGGWIKEPGAPTEALRNEGINITKIIHQLTTLGFEL